MVSWPLIIDIPGVPVSVNHIWKRGRHGMYKTKDASEYQEYVQKCCRLAIGGEDYRKAVRSHVEDGGKVRVTLRWVRPDKRRRDTSNIIKLAEDSLSHALSADDRSFEWTTFSEFGTKATAGIRLEVGLE